MAETSLLCRTISAFGLGEQVGNPGPDLDTKEIASKLLRLLQYPNHYKDNIAYWQRRSQESIGSKGAASIIKQAAIDQAAQYKKAFALNKHQFTTPFKANS